MNIDSYNNLLNTKIEVEFFQYPYGKNPKILLPKKEHIISHSVKTARWWEYWFITELYKLSIENSEATYFDIGANIGTNSIIASEFFSHIYAFEIEPDNCELFHYSMNMNNISYSLYPYAVSDSSGQVGVYLNKSNIGGHSIVPESKEEPDFQVKKICLDEFDSEVRNVGFLHIDTQGHDFKVLKGAYKFIERQAKKPIIEIEFSPSLLVKHGSSIDELLLFMDTFNYSAYINGSSALAPITRATLTDMFYLWKQSNPWIDLYLIPNL